MPTCENSRKSLARSKIRKCSRVPFSLALSPGEDRAHDAEYRAVAQSLAGRSGGARALCYDTRLFPKNGTGIDSLTRVPEDAAR
jgi:hypothetical protein